MDLKSALAAQGYAATRPATAPGKARPAESANSLTKLAENFEQTLAKGETTAIASMTGNADPHALVQAIAQTELAVEAAVTVRNKVVEAYQEILRMPV